MDELTEEQNKEVLDTQVITKVLVIAQICKIIDGCNKRGAFKAEELSYIGEIYESLQNVVKNTIEKVKNEK